MAQGNPNISPGVRKNLHIIGMMALMAVVLAGLAFQYLTSEQKPKQEKQQEQVYNLQPEVERLRREMERQKEEAERRARELELRKQELEGLQSRLGSETERLRAESRALRERLAEQERRAKEESARRAAKEKKEELARASKLVAVSAQDFTASFRNQNSAQFNMPLPTVQPGVPTQPENGAIQEIARMMKEQQGNRNQRRGLLDANEQWRETIGAANDASVIRVLPAPSGPMIQQGTVIPAVLLSGINSDLPGLINARITRDVYDSVQGTTLIIPKGSRVVGVYNTSVQDGQNRVMVAFKKLYFPDGRSVDIAGMPGADVQGVAGIAADVDTHFWKMLGSSMLVAAISFAFENELVKSGSNGGDTVNVSLGNGSSGMSSAGQILRDTADKATRGYQDIPPTLTVGPGTPFNIIVNRDIYL